MEMIDIAIIGAGPAGVSAALTAKARGKNIAVFSQSGISEKVSKAHKILNYPGLSEISGEDLAKAFENHLHVMEVPLIKKQISAVYSFGEYFALQTADEPINAKAVIIACGVMAQKPIEGENEFLGRGVSYCATCDAMFFKGKTVAVWGLNGEAPSEAEFLAEGCKKVLYFSNKPQEFKKDNIEHINDIPIKVLGDKTLNKIGTKNGEFNVDGFFILRDTVSPEVLVPGLKTENNHIAVDKNMCTNIAGCFACGDTVGKPYQYVKAAGEGNIAALSAVEYLKR